MNRPHISLWSLRDKKFIRRTPYVENGRQRTPYVENGRQRTPYMENRRFYVDVNKSFWGIGRAGLRPEQLISNQF
mgnify:CR=1 FL=1